MAFVGRALDRGMILLILSGVELLTLDGLRGGVDGFSTPRGLVVGRRGSTERPCLVRSLPVVGSRRTCGLVAGLRGGSTVRPVAFPCPLGEGSLFTRGLCRAGTDTRLRGVVIVSGRPERPVDTDTPRDDRSRVFILLSLP